MHDLQVLHHVRAAGEIVLTVGRPALFALGFGLEAHQPHQTLHPFAVNKPSLKLREMVIIPELAYGQAVQA